MFSPANIIINCSLTHVVIELLLWLNLAAAVGNTLACYQLIFAAGPSRGRMATQEQCCSICITIIWLDLLSKGPFNSASHH